jgi:MFS family permease
VDRWDRRRVLWITDAYRSMVVGALAIAVVAGWASIPLLGVAGFLLATGGTLFTPAAQSIVPSIVSREPVRLERANGRMAAAQTVGDHLAGPPLGGLLFSLARPAPFLADAVSFAVSAALIATLPGRFAPASGRGWERRAPAHSPPGERGGLGPEAATAARPAGLRAEIVEGLGWLGRHRLLRALALMNAIASLAFSAWTAIMVLFAQDRLGLGNIGYGLLWTGVAAGSLLGSVLAAQLGRTLGPRRVLLGSATAFGATTLGIGLSTSPWAAGVLLGVLGLALTVWNVVVVSLRQAIVPDRLVGRVNSAFQLVSLGVMPLGSAVGGALGHTLGLRAPFLAGGVALLAAALLAARIVTTHAIDVARAAERRGNQSLER